MIQKLSNKEKKLEDILKIALKLKTGNIEQAKVSAGEYARRLLKDGAEKGITNMIKTIDDYLVNQPAVIADSFIRVALENDINYTENELADMFKKVYVASNPVKNAISRMTQNKIINVEIAKETAKNNGSICYSITGLKREYQKEGRSSKEVEKVIEKAKNNAKINIDMGNYLPHENNKIFLPLKKEEDSFVPAKSLSEDELKDYKVEITAKDREDIFGSFMLKRYDQISPQIKSNIIRKERERSMIEKTITNERIVEKINWKKLAAATILGLGIGLTFKHMGSEEKVKANEQKIEQKETEIKHKRYTVPTPYFTQTQMFFEYAKSDISKDEKDELKKRLSSIINTAYNKAYHQTEGNISEEDFRKKVNFNIHYTSMTSIDGKFSGYDNKSLAEARMGSTRRLVDNMMGDLGFSKEQYKVDYDYKAEVITKKDLETLRDIAKKNSLSLKNLVQDYNLGGYKRSGYDPSRKELTEKVESVLRKYRKSHFDGITVSLKGVKYE